MAHPGGRPTKYKPEYVEQVYKLALLGHIDKEIAKIFGVNELTINRWKDDYPEFCKSLKQGKAEHDDNLVEASLLARAKGYSHPDVDIRVCNNQIIETPIIKHYPPDPTSMIFWLKNRQPAKWRDKQEVEHSGKVQIDTIEVNHVDQG